MARLDQQFDEEDFEVRCELCDEYIVIEYYLDQGDLVTCEECEADYLIKSRDPFILAPVDEEESDDDYY